MKIKKLHFVVLCQLYMLHIYKLYVTNFIKIFSLVQKQVTINKRYKNLDFRENYEKLQFSFFNHL